METLVKNIGTGSQDVVYVEIVRTIDPRMLRVEIKSDSYDNQCYARISVWSGDKWEHAHAIHYSLMSTPTKLAYGKKKANARDFKKDRDELLRVAFAIIASQEVRA